MMFAQLVVARQRNRTYSFFFFGPGLPRLAFVAGLAPSMAAALLLALGLGPLRLAADAASDEGVLVPFMVAAASIGVSAGVGSAMCGAGVSDGDEVGFDSRSGGVNDSWGNLSSTSRERVSATMNVLFLAFVDMFVAAQMGSVVRWPGRGRC